jgi:DNA mismatch repair protein MutS
MTSYFSKGWRCNKEGFNEELDRLRGIISGGKILFSEIEQREKERTGIKI